MRHRVPDERNGKQGQEREGKRMMVPFRNQTAMPHRPRRARMNRGFLFGFRRVVGFSGTLLESGEQDVKAHLEKLTFPIL
jgi:hypothetical protein